jgi:hypothetical protein
MSAGALSIEAVPTFSRMYGLGIERSAGTLAISSNARPDSTRGLSGASPPASQMLLQAAEKSPATHGAADRGIYTAGPLSSDEDPVRWPRWQPSCERDREQRAHARLVSSRRKLLRSCRCPFLRCSGTGRSGAHSRPRRDIPRRGCSDRFRQAPTSGAHRR